MARLVLSLLDPHLTLEVSKNVSFANKCSFDCRATNLEKFFGRKTTMKNRSQKVGFASAYKGVRKRLIGKKTEKFYATISDGGLRVGLGSYDTEIEAARVYDAAAWLLFDRAAASNVTKGQPKLADIEIAAVRIRNYKERRRKNEP